MQNNIGRKSMLRVLRQLRSKDGGGGLGAVPCRAVPGHAARRSAWRSVLHNCREFTPDRIRRIRQRHHPITRRARSTFLQDCNPVLYHLRHTFLMKTSVLNTRFPILVYYTVLYHTILYFTILYYTILYYTKLYYTILYYTILLCR
jgi:hypothetical protein